MARGGRRAGAGRPKGTKNKRTIAKVPLLPAQAHRKTLNQLARGAGEPEIERASPETVEELPLDVLTKAMRDTSLPIELRLAAAAKAARYYHARVSGGPPKASFEMSDSELENAIAREKEYALRTATPPAKTSGRRAFRPGSCH